MTASPYHDAELADTLEAERLKRVRAACTTVPSIDQLAASGGERLSSLPEISGNRNKRALDTARLTGAASPSVATTSKGRSHPADSAPGIPAATPMPFSEERATDFTNNRGRSQTPSRASASVPTKEATHDDG